MKMTDEQFKEHIRAVVLPLIKESLGGDQGKSIADAVEAQVTKSLGDQAYIKSLLPAWVNQMTAGKPSSDDKPKREKGDSGARVIRAAANAALAKSGVKGIEEILKRWGDDDLAGVVEKDAERRDAIAKAAMSVTDATAGGFLVPETLSSDVIELLRPMSVVRDLVGSSLPMPNGTVSIPKITQGSTAYYQGENSAATKSALATGMVKLTWRKLTALVPMSNDLLRYSSPSADAIVRRDMVRAIAQRENQAFLRDTGVDSAPKGLRWLAANSGSPIFANATVNLANVTTDLGKMILDLMNDNIPMTRCAWIMAPRTYMYLFTLLTTNGVFAFRDEMARGSLWGYPFRLTTQVPINLTDHGGTDESELYFADFDDVIIGDSMNLRVDASDVATYTDGANTVSAFSNDQTVVRCITEHDFNTRRAESISIMNGVRWFA
jgi:HK97 family phage major capsid protein